MTWTALKLEPGLVHVLPDDDLVQHDETERCVCQPTPELVLNEDGPDGWVIVHHSLDGREHNE